jgi:hypothetical protein
MKIFATIFLTFTIFIQTFSTFIIKADFYINQSYIAKNLCVNKDKPMMHCNGKCYLSKKLKQQEQDQTPVSRTEKFDVQPFFVSPVFLLKNTYTVLQHHYFIQDENIVSSFPRSIFHPPTA